MGEYILYKFAYNLFWAVFTFFVCYLIISKRKGKKLTPKYRAITFLITLGTLTFIQTIGAVLKVNSFYSLIIAIGVSIFTILTYFSKEDAVILAPGHKGL